MNWTELDRVAGAALLKDMPYTLKLALQRLHDKGHSKSDIMRTVKKAAASLGKPDCLTVQACDYYLDALDQSATIIARFEKGEL